MKMSSVYNNGLALLLATLALLLTTTVAAPMQENEDEANSLLAQPDASMNDVDLPWDPASSAALRRLLLQFDADRLTNRVGRSWPQAEPRGWSMRPLDGRLVRQWRADKRQVRFRQCYFNPISCFRK